ncbi:MAG: FtsX-like permease family protein [Planctomycetota bacterium]|nr:FtsX-like permease family protein [Planctomycetota bacterium]
MYRWLLCWRYLRTRYIALASVVSVMLGVATLIIVNSVMDGFTTEMQDRMHGILSDVVIESHSAEGLFVTPQIEAAIREAAGDDLVGITTVVHVPAMVTIDSMGETLTRQINLIGIDERSYADVSDFSKYLLHPENQEKISFLLKETGYAPEREGFPESGWIHRRQKAKAMKQMEAMHRQLEEEQRRNEQLRAQMTAATAVPAMQAPQVDARTNDTTHSAEPPSHGLAFPDAPTHLQAPGLATQATSNPPPVGSPNLPTYQNVASLPSDVAQVFDAEREQHDGIVMGISIGSTRYRDLDGNIRDGYYVQPGDDIQVTFPSAGATPRAINEKFTVVDFYESKMSEYDATFAFVPLDRLQKYRGMQGTVSSVQLKLRDDADLAAVRDRLRATFAGLMLEVNTWRDLQGALLAAVQMETTILNILLFLIIAVAGFGILATFFMIVVEKTKDIGILKSLGASGTGVASIFLGYGVMLGTFGAGVGAIAGLIFVANINKVADLLETITGQEVFDPTVYYFESIPTIVHPGMVVFVILGAVAIAVLASVLPSIRAARMHPVEALRYE